MDPDLAAVMEAWPKLAAEQRAAIWITFAELVSTLPELAASGRRSGAILDCRTAGALLGVSHVLAHKMVEAAGD
jgi:hypothetical protein